MVIELKRGYTIESNYDKFTDSYITRLLDENGKQVRDAMYSGDIVGRNYDTQSIRDFFTTYMKDSNFNTDNVKNEEDIEEPIEDMFNDIGDIVEEPLEESLITESVGNLYVYHATDRRNIESINKSGLLINSGTSNWEKMYCEGMVFLALSAEVAIDYVESQENIPDDVVLLKIPASIFEYEYVGYDWNNRCEYHEDINSFTYSKNIPIEHLQVCDPKNEPYQDIDNFRHTDIGEKILQVFYEECETNMEYMEESLDMLDKKARKTKIATKKAKLPITSIIPDPVGGINRFNAATADGNSGIASTTGSTGLGEAYMSRNEITTALKKMGFKYKFDKYSDKQLYRIYQERLKKLDKQARENNRKQQESNYEYNKRENSKDSYMKDGIEFESEDAAREYFGESMEKKFYINDMHEAWNIEEDFDSKQFLNESIKKKINHNFPTLHEGFKHFERSHFESLSEDLELEALYESMRDKLSSEDVKKLGAFMNHAQDAEEVLTYMKGLLAG